MGALRVVVGIGAYLKGSWAGFVRVPVNLSLITINNRQRTITYVSELKHEKTRSTDNKIENVDAMLRYKLVIRLLCQNDDLGFQAILFVIHENNKTNKHTNIFTPLTNAYYNTPQKKTLELKQQPIIAA
ncbi:Hypothetical_protein [Hexamita inflata]|uniref:Hypothetical_protein n=1 Tax=Hexamita inflata TaxID=28002 RepID=A0AA86USN4_9EUKA|nr:Hypothetical protein HINF_LOCUS57810 [Hexamita inflata]